MKSERFRYVMLLYGALLVTGCAAWFLAPDVFFVVLLATGGALSCTAWQSIHESYIGGHLSARRKLLNLKVMVLLTVVSAIATVVTYVTSDRIEWPGLWLGFTVYSLQCLALRRPGKQIWLP
ncbi:hypothetical protein [Pseudoduganella umbonata]|uniref:Putative membrane protein n=1 Tax=Pseudoduganella umbonata TaxID=864828 RepID=A0A4P8HPN6_9BURK|nr:hypothetical protein [Pseudoduganella umbonata]MBB3221089.1 putative membrane protein [Pseudoduganella umbonata]QCP10285.1 hypothetical protein FCL38_07490 [Pseudoduganella umbonata]